MKLHWTDHAKAQAKARSGHPLRQLTRHIEKALRQGNYYCPSERIQERNGNKDEMWVAVDGPRGKATAVVVDEDDGLLVITVRESESCTQGESALRPMRHLPFKDLLGGMVL
jgi:hypothetical protein